MALNISVKISWLKDDVWKWRKVNCQMGFFYFHRRSLKKNMCKNVKGIEFEQNMIADNKGRLKKNISYVILKLHLF